MTADEQMDEWVLLSLGSAWLWTSLQSRHGSDHKWPLPQRDTPGHWALCSEKFVLTVNVSVQIQGAQMGHVRERNQDSLQGMTTGIGRHDTGRPLTVRDDS